MMKHYLIHGVVVLAAVCLVGTQAEEMSTVGKENLPMPKVFSFENFKKTFRKEYRTPGEEEVREKIYLARAFKAFLSLIEYKNYRKSYYLKINEMSDWTEEEFLSIMNPRAFMEPPAEVPGRTTSIGMVETPVASFEEIKKKLDEVVDMPEYSKIRDELTVSRVKRDTEGGQVASNRASLTVNDLVGKQDGIVEILDKVPSSNPNYEPPELMSFGTNGLDAPLIQDIEDFSLITLASGDEYLDKLLSKHLENMQNKANSPPGKNQSDEDILVVDHRRSNCLTGPKNQAQCNAGYIFAVNSLYEFQYCLETKSKTSFSEQYVLDCGDRAKLDGCRGGNPVDVGSFYAKYGFELTSAYPYMRTSYVCPYEEDTSFVHMGYLKLSGRNEPFMKAFRLADVGRILEYEPILMNVALSDHFNMYGGGIDDGSGCDGQRVQTMVIVGMGKHNGLEYWLLRNSYGTTWGEHGYYKLDKTASDKCFFQKYGYYLYNKTHQPLFIHKTNMQRVSEEVLNRRKEIYSGQYIEPHPSTLT